MPANDLPYPASPAGLLQGLVIRAQSGFLVVRTEQGDFTCRVRGRLKQVKQDEHKGDVVAVGDRVLIDPLPDNTGSIEEILPRRAVFSRKKINRNIEYDYQRIMLANPDQVVLVFACAHPEPHLRLLDRFLVVAESQEIPVLIVANKIDLIPEAAARARFSTYQKIGYDVLYTSAKKDIGITALRDRLAGKISVLSGPSGVGKSSLLNALQPDLGLEVRSVSQANKKGRHTTQVSELFPLDQGGYVADMPGLRTMALWDIEPEELDGYFPEMRSLVADCQFNDCTHSHEPGCAVIAAVRAGRMSEERYQSYLRLRFEGGMDEDPDSFSDED